MVGTCHRSIREFHVDPVGEKRIINTFFKADTNWLKSQRSPKTACSCTYKMMLFRVDQEGLLCSTQHQKVLGKSSNATCTRTRILPQMKKSYDDIFLWQASALWVMTYSPYTTFPEWIVFWQKTNDRITNKPCYQKTKPNKSRHNKNPNNWMMIRIHEWYHYLQDQK